MRSSRERKRPTARAKAAGGKAAWSNLARPLSPDRLSLIHNLLALCPDAMALIDSDAIILAANESFAMQTHVPADRIVGYPGQEEPPDWLAKLGEKCRNVRESRQPFSSEAYLIDFEFEAGKQTVYWDVTISPVLFSGDFCGCLVLGRDVTERERAQQQLRDSEKHYRLIVDTVLEGIWVIDTHYKTTYVNSAMAAMLGYDLDGMIGRSLFAFMDKSSEAAARAAIRRRRRSKNEEHDFRFQRKDGSDLWAIVSIAPVFDRNDVYAGSYALITDITRRKQVEEDCQRLASLNQELAREATESAQEAWEQTEELQALLENVAEGVAVMDRDGRFSMMNRAARDLIGLPPDFAGTPESFSAAGVQVLRLDGTPVPDEKWTRSRILRGERFTGREVVFVLPNGAKKKVSIGGSSVKDRAGKVTKAIFVLHDVTELRRLEEMREEYLSLISHDLRNPLTVIQGHAQSIHKETERMERAGWHGQSRRSAELILASAQRMNRMIRDLLESVRLESGQLHLKKRPVSIRQLISELLEREATIIEWRRVRLEFPEEVLPVQADPDCLERILINLVSNALAYSPEGGDIVLRVERMGDELLISVVDHGAGIPEDDLPHIFERLYRVKRERWPGGIGLGLHICKLLVEAHGGRIWVQSRLGEGSTFYVALPMAGQ